MPAPPPDNADREPRTYPQIPQQGPGGFDGQLLAVRRGPPRGGRRGRHVARSSTPSTRSQHVPWTNQVDFKEALAATLAKSPEDRRVFDLVFERFFFRAAEAQAARRGITEGGATQATAEQDNEINLDTLRQQIAAALRDGSDAALRDLARLAISAFGRGEGSGVLGVDVQRIRRALGLRPEPQPDLPEDDPRRDGVPRDQLRRFEQHLRRELERNLIERTASLPPKRPLNELDRALPTGPIQDLAAVHRVVAQLKRRLATQGHELKGRKRHAHVDFRRTMRASPSDRRRADRPQVPPPAPPPPRDLRAVRRVHERHQRQHVLPQRPARAPRRIPQAPLVRVHRADLGGHRGVRARARLPRRQPRRSPRTPASPTSPATPTTAACGPSSWR